MLTAASTTAIMTNAVPITAGFVLSGQRLPHGYEPSCSWPRSRAWWRVPPRSDASRRPDLSRTEAAVSPVWAAVAMLVQNVLAVLLVQAEARNRAVLAGLLDCLMWPAGMVTTTITVTALQGHHAGLKTEVIAAVTLANFAGSSAAVKLGRRFIKARRE